MANTDAPFGFRPVMHRGGAPYNGAANMYALDTAAFPDAVATGTGDDTSTTFSVFYAANIATTTEAHSDYRAALTYVITGNF